ncbi:hypothetical protein Psesu_1135 [Pseudoxanthomonas suwonensis 11-1]|uniref:Uncharacterized protein n=1 Tax=Pseudoxanthomonas suwonensis (strain 11-1) TaxID=743721 RepID=E6WS36_PSEUU|nr:hypothetical protein [Pseudoxanthomonas suwonensis]ADV26985.1 hypothetical protein Psesu_1135 [Pseudoxanthomonas suwonensis 11-1]
MTALAYHRMPGFGDLSGPRDPQNAPLGDYEADRDAELRDQLAHSPALLGEVALSEDEAQAAARLLRTGDAVGFMALFRTAVDRHIGELVEVRQNDKPWLSESEAVEQLAGVYA